MIKLGTDKFKLMLGDKKVKYVYQGASKEYSSGSIVSYYDENTLLGTEEVEEGLDVLHPDIDTSKTGYTLVGWGTSTDLSSMVRTMTATGDDITLYALYLPNSLLVATGSVTNSAGHTSYSGDSLSAAYISGALGCTAERAGYIAGAGSCSASAIFTVKLGMYKKATISWNVATGMGDNQWFSVDGIDTSSGSKVVTVDGSHTLQTGGSTPGNSWNSCTIGITNITLSEPKEWV